MDRFGMDFDEALKEAQALGYAEADPTADIGGFDVANKAVIPLLWRAAPRLRTIFRCSASRK